jgi:hypothetical protein
MIGAIVVFLIVLAIVGSYIIVVNRMLRSDEHWAESSPIVSGEATPVVAYPSVAAGLVRVNSKRYSSASPILPSDVRRFVRAGFPIE